MAHPIRPATVPSLVAGLTVLQKISTIALHHLEEGPLAAQNLYGGLRVFESLPGGPLPQKAL